MTNMNFKQIGNESIKVFCLLIPLLLIPFLTNKNYIVHEITIFMLFLSIVIYWNIVFGFGGILSLGQTAFYGIGGYTLAISLKFGGLSMLPATLLSAAVSLIFGIIVGFACLRLRGAYVAFITLAILIALQALIQTDIKCMFKLEFVCSSLTGGSMGMSRFGKIDDINFPGPFKFSYIIILINYK